jgi:hypothetical protein
MLVKRVVLAILIVCTLLYPAKALEVHLLKTGVENGYYDVKIAIKGDGTPTTVTLTYYVFENGRYIAKYLHSYFVGKPLEYYDRILVKHLRTKSYLVAHVSTLNKSTYDILTFP